MLECCSRLQGARIKSLIVGRHRVRHRVVVFPSNLSVRRNDERIGSIARRTQIARVRLNGNIDTLRKRMTDGQKRQQA